MAEEALYVIPLKPDPPFTIDGDLADWRNVPNQFVIADQAHCTYTPGKWKGPDDLSARGRMAWRPGVLYLGLEIADDVIAQNGRGFDMWRGDHVELYLDFNPGHEPQRDTFGAGQWQFGLSPGNFKNTGDPLADLRGICNRGGADRHEGQRPVRLERRLATRRARLQRAGRRGSRF